MKVKATNGKSLLVDTFVIVAISILICFFSKKLLLMSIVVPLILAVRLIYTLIRFDEKKQEIILYTICTILGAFNDWNSVVGKGVYDYHAPVYFPEFSTIPIWMLLYWGMILRYMAAVAWWPGLGKDVELKNEVHLGSKVWKSTPTKIILQLAIVFVTRQFIYHYYLDSVLSFAPFVVALILYSLIFRPNKREIKLGLLCISLGTVVEILYIGAGDLHYYHHGILFGVPIWISLWWSLSVIIWKDIYKLIEQKISSPSICN
ncbi:MAG: hypothetical protein HOE90_10500 [Bacteriovoracaceae bacterium]|nr:hypothetical protein [Bacteriovoracaceae bacterium]